MFQISLDFCFCLLVSSAGLLRKLQRAQAPEASMTTLILLVSVVLPLFIVVIKCNILSQCDIHPNPKTCII